MLQDRHNINSGRQDEASHRFVSQQGGNDLYDSENPRLGELEKYRLEEPTTKDVGGIEIEEQGPQARRELHRKRLDLVSDHSQDSEGWEGDHARNVLYTHSANPRLREPRAYHRRKPTTELASDIIVEERRPRTYARPPRKYLSHRGYGSDSDEWDGEYTTLKDQKAQYEHSETPQSKELGPYQTAEQINDKRPKGDRKQKPVIVQEQGIKAGEQPVNETKKPSEETQERPAPHPFRKEAPFGPYHHYRGRG